MSEYAILHISRCSSAYFPILQLASHGIPGEKHVVSFAIDFTAHFSQGKLCRMMQPGITAEEVRLGQLTGCLDALHSGVTTILDHFHIANTPEHCDAALEATIQSGARVIFCLARQSPATQLLPELKFDREAETRTWQLSKFKQWGSKNAGKLSDDGRVLLGLA